MTPRKPAATRNSDDAPSAAAPAKAASSRDGARPRGGDRLDDLRAQWVASGRGGDFDFSEFVGGMTIVDQLIEREFKRFVTSRFDMSPGDMRILMALRRAPERALRPTDLFKQLLVTSGAITKQVDRLEASGLVRREFNRAGKRGWLIQLTDKGHSVIDASDMADSLPATRAVFYSLTRAQRAETLRLLHLMVQAIQRHTEHNPID